MLTPVTATHVQNAAEYRNTTYLSVHLWQQLQQLLLRVCREGGEGPHIDEGSDVGVDQDGAWGFKVHIHPSPTPPYGPCQGNKHTFNSDAKAICSTKENPTVAPGI